MKTMLLAFVFTAVALPNVLYAQFQDPHQLYPSAVGNKWRWHDNLTSSTYDTEITRDSVLSNGTRYLFFNHSDTARFFVDTSRQVFQIVAGVPVIWYKLDAQPGDSFSTSVTGSQYLVRVGSFSGTAFGIPVAGRTFSWYYGLGSQPFAVQQLLYGIGVVALYADIGPVDQYVTGYTINGLSYGTLAAVEPIPNQSPVSFWLEHPFPNPFNPSTTIQFSVPKESYVSLQVFDLLGRSVATLVDGVKSAGAHKVTFTGNNLTSGVYIIRLQAGHFFQTQKVTLAK